MKIDTLVLGNYENNSYIVRKNADSMDCIVIDTGLDVEPLVKFLKKNSLSPAALVLTHGHADHIAGAAAVKSEFPAAKICIHKDDANMLCDDEQNLSKLADISITSPGADVLVEDGEKISFAGVELEVIHTPGHTPGGICLYSDEDKILFSGDTLFAGSVGRTDFSGYDNDKRHRQLVENIKARLFKLADETKVLTGHGPGTSIAAEKQTNPYLG